MTALLLGTLTLLILLWAAKAFTRVRPESLLAKGEKLLSWVVLVTALGFLVTGRWFIALVLMPLGLAALGLPMLWSPYLPSLSVPRFRTRYLDMAMDLRRGLLHGKIRTGPHAGRDLASFDEAELMTLFDEFQDDAESCNLLAAYLDRRFSSRREHPHAHARTGQGGARAAHALSQEEAYEILGLQKGASLKEIGEAHRRLMKGFHPDAGGSNWLAAKINAAKDLLIRTHY